MQLPPNKRLQAGMRMSLSPKPTIYLIPPSRPPATRVCWMLLDLCIIITIIFYTQFDIAVIMHNMFLRHMRQCVFRYQVWFGKSWYILKTCILSADENFEIKAKPWYLKIFFKNNVFLAAAETHLHLMLFLIFCWLFPHKFFQQISSFFNVLLHTKTFAAYKSQLIRLCFFLCLTNTLAHRSRKKH